MTHLEEQIDRLHVVLSQLRKRLEDRGYCFQEPQAILPGPEMNTDSALARIEE